MTSTANAIEYVPSPQQARVLDWVQNGRGSAFIEAVAGAGKTTTLVQALARTEGSVAFAAYNKKIADEIKAKTSVLGLGNRLRVGTFHSFGFSAWRRVHPDVKVDDYAKRDRLVAALEVPRDLEAVVLRLVSLAKQSAVGLLWNAGHSDRWYDIVDHHDLESDLEDPGQIGRAIELAARAIRWSREVSHELIDFDDMIWLPVTSEVRIWQNDWVLVDEAQDTNPARRALTRKMLLNRGRAIFVGDRHQAIYGFTGADNDAIDQIIRDFNCTTLPLTVTYRCPQNVVAEAQRFVSHIEAHESAPVGKVAVVGTPRVFWEDVVPTLTERDAILCRNVKPLVSTAFALIKRGIACHVEGRDIGQGLIKLATRWKVKTAEALRGRLATYLDREKQKLQAKGRETLAQAIEDKVDTLMVLLEGCDTVDCVVEKINRMFKDTPEGTPAPTLTLSTVHKSKGREWPRVLILGFDTYMPSPYARQAWQQDQERNLQYVAITRSQDELVFLPTLS